MVRAAVQVLGAAIDTDVDPAPLLQGLDTNTMIATLKSTRAHPQRHRRKLSTRCE
jgi:hypothetical protein